ncbi:MAG TPA: methylmalonyl Co-A mutase-associated GTPase MeaB [Saprospiraceae bacterium]|nr:methylmalonyl Co-A mutase-associated GTPase MeaB [Saprospiraceae bacterium]HPI07962.1 methylmalonyl Co-A mutase-associated GTPase MeaB [Saprospiraceae bacterium]
MRRQLPSVEEFVQGIRSGDRVLLGQAITLVESTRPEHGERAQQVIARLLEQAPARPTLRIGITGAPGAGKSTLIEALGLYLTGQGHRVAVLAIDPTSAVSKGSILGDKTRMERLSADPNAFIRPSPSGESLGGVARKTRETILLTEAAGYDIVLIETVGVGQSEIAVHSMTDLFLLLLLPGAGDELQGIKRGIVEMADLLAVNKADGDRLKLANQARMHYLNAVHLLPLKPSGWAPRVLACSAEQGTGIAELWDAIGSFRQQVTESGYLDQNRRQQAAYWLKESLDSGLQTLFYQNPEIREKLAALEPLVLEGRISPFAAARQLLQHFRPDNERF